MKSLAPLVLVLGLAACSSIPAPPDSRTSDAPAIAQRTGSGEQRTDLKPLTSRFALLATAESAVWLSGTMGDSRVSGPSTYWIDAIVTLATTDDLRERYNAVQAPTPPVVESPIDEQLPDGPYFTSPELDAAFSQNGADLTIHLSADGHTLILRSVFE